MTAQGTKQRKQPAASAQLSVPAVLLRARLAAVRAGAAGCVAALLCVAGAAAWAWLIPQRAEQRVALARPLPAPGALVVAAPPPSANENLALFQETLGEKRYAEQHVKVLFGLATKAGLSLNQGEYKLGYDKASRVASYQITLPVKGSYQAIWQFALTALRELPFAALDDIGFRRENIGDTQVEARMRFTLYLKDLKDGAVPGQP
ncbi:hypothetical protein ASD15_21670 [Massilia sp. Root351]|jgi:hypothetical protein|uniref:hypothetical protein n=1 Tax=Massilia sp. Root351 TaxID=1736522 RepID=UPI00070B980E|nr:hypothetical protein [Massilia sp. Root351]KQV78431.1 hypothetical protein ASD15_21670 [Massilia sp. Root351]